MDLEGGRKKRYKVRKKIFYEFGEENKKRYEVRKKILDGFREEKKKRYKVRKKKIGRASCRERV